MKILVAKREHAPRGVKLTEAGVGSTGAVDTISNRQKTLGLRVDVVFTYSDIFLC